MELPGTAYLIALAALAMAFMGFASLVTIFLRPATGGPLTPYDTFFTLSFVQLGFVIVLGSLLPPLLALYGLPESTIWRGSSGAIAIPYGLFCVAAPLRRRAVGEKPGATYFGLLSIPHLAALGTLILTAADIPLGPGGAVYASVMTAILATTGLGYLLGLRVLLLAGHPRAPRDRA